MTFHHGQVVITRNTPQAYLHRVTLLKCGSFRHFQARKTFFLQFPADSLDWVESTKSKIRCLPQCSAITPGIHGMARYNRYEGYLNARNDDGKMMKSGLLKLILFSGMVSLGGCSSVMSHTGGKEGTYPGTRASAEMLGNSDANWGTKSLVALDMPFTAVMDTLLLPWDMFRTDSSIKSRVEKSEKSSLATNAAIPPAAMPAP